MTKADKKRLIAVEPKSFSNMFNKWIGNIVKSLITNCIVLSKSGVTKADKKAIVSGVTKA